MSARVMFLLASFPIVTFAGLENNGRGTRPIGLGNAFVAVGNSPWATVYNPAGLTSVRSMQGAVFCVPEQFGMKELRTISAAIAIPFGPGTACVMIEQFGFELYRETSLALGLGIVVDDGLAGGLTINIDRISIERYGNATKAIIDAGAVVDVREDFHLGFNWKNVAATGVGANDERLPQVLIVGASYDISRDSRCTFELEKDIRHPFIAKAGYEQRFLDVFSLRFGASNNPDKFSFGIGVLYAGIEFSYAGYSHARLGWTHQVELSFKIP